MPTPLDLGAAGQSASADAPPCAFVVLKFGGTSVSSLANWERIAGIVEQRLSETSAGGAGAPKVVVVHSALSGATDALGLALDQVLERRRNSDTASGPYDVSSPVGKHKGTLAALVERHVALGQELGLRNVEALLSSYQRELERVVEGASLIGEVSARTRARVVAMGELLSTTLGAEYLKQRLGDGRVAWLDSREVLRSEPVRGRNFGTADVERSYLQAAMQHEPSEDMRRRLQRSAASVFVAQGFIGSNAEGDTVLLGRGGSDTSAAYMASILAARRLEIWTDVPGMFSANPRLIPEARLLKSLSFDEAQEIATTGAKVLHPRCIGPVRRHGIPTVICDTFRPKLAGTEIGAAAVGGSGLVKAISVRSGVVVVNLSTLDMWGGAGFLADAFRVFKEQGVSVDLVSTSESSVTVTVDAGEVDDEVMAAVKEELSGLCEVTVIQDCASVSLVGQAIRKALHRLSPALLAFRETQVHMMTQAANDLNLTFVVDGDHADTIARELHTALITQPFGGPGEEVAEDLAACYGLPWCELPGSRPSTPGREEVSVKDDKLTL